jgi:6-aminohexanoate-oligomer endohydrolase
MNPLQRLEPRIPAVAPGAQLRYDFPGLRIGVAEYDEGPTGCTVLHLAGGANCAVDVRGGSPGLLGAYPRCEAVCLAGGSL